MKNESPIPMWGKLLEGKAAAESFEGHTVAGAITAITDGWNVEVEDGLNGFETMFILSAGGRWAMIRVRDTFDDVSGEMLTWERFTHDEKVTALRNAVASAMIAEDPSDLLRSWLLPGTDGTVPVQHLDWALALLSLVDRPEIVAARIRVTRGEFGPVQEALADRNSVRTFARSVIRDFDPESVADRILRDIQDL